MIDTKDFTKTSYLELEAKHAKLEQGVKDALVSIEMHSCFTLTPSESDKIFSDGMIVALGIVKDYTKL